MSQQYTNLDISHTVFWLVGSTASSFRVLCVVERRLGEIPNAQHTSSIQSRKRCGLSPRAKAGGLSFTRLQLQPPNFP